MDGSLKCLSFSKKCPSAKHTVYLLITENSNGPFANEVSHILRVDKIRLRATDKKDLNFNHSYKKALTKVECCQSAAFVSHKISTLILYMSFQSNMRQLLLEKLQNYLIFHGYNWHAVYCIGTWQGLQLWLGYIDAYILFHQVFVI